ncbi:MFS transporter [Micromonospora thermarum]|uniref:MFS transporter n=1 Tax=Micromonospora thermarum TaxID=2720024 RepID=A0ABX0ZI17_9ACTN|nr:MFS transporter [Micromonospora thermarum]NJP35435.1 MFS transporter [Micromonospora thermarum]
MPPPARSPGSGPARPPLSAWRFVIWFGIVAMLADVVYEGARSITGPLLAGLGASAFTVGVVTGVGEASALALRLVSGPLADRTGRFWAWALAGYGLTVVSVPLLGLASVVWVAGALVIAERVGKAVRQPAKDTLLSHAAAVTGRGRGFAAHEALDQAGALVGPLAVAAVLAASGGDYGPALLALAVPGALALTVLVWLRVRVPHPARYETGEAAEQPRQRDRATPEAAGRLPGRFWVYATFAGLTMTGFATFGVLSFHLVEADLLPATAVPVLYAAAMVVDAVAAIATGWAYDLYGARVLVVLPIVAATVPALAFAPTVGLAVAGVLVWGAVLGVQESTLKATVADLVGPGRRATAFGVFGAVVGVAAAAGGALTGGLYETSVPLLVAVTGTVQAVALGVLLTVLRRARVRSPGRGGVGGTG